MAGIDVGGDTSVMWQVEVQRLRSMTVDPSDKGQPERHRHTGIDETDAEQFFNVSIEVPKDPTHKNNLAFALQAASTSVMNAPAGSGSRFSFVLPIEEHNINQIQIRWNSSPARVGTRRLPGASRVRSSARSRKRRSGRGRRR